MAALRIGGVGTTNGGKPYTTQEGELLAQVAAHVAQAIRRAGFSPAALDHRRNGDGRDGEDHLEAAATGPAGGAGFGISAHTGEIS